MSKFNITFSQALEGYELYFDAQQLSEHTRLEYWKIFAKFHEFLGEDMCLAKITKQHIQTFLASYSHLKKKTVLNYHTGLSSFWTWAVSEGLCEEHIVRQVKPPKPSNPVIVPYTEDEVRLMVASCERSRPYLRRGQLEKSSHALPHPERNRAILLTLVDTGVRASELCNINVKDVDFKNKRITVHGKGDKFRVIPFSSRTGRIIWRYLRTRSDVFDNSPLFVTKDDEALRRHGLARLIKSIGQRANVPKAYPHRFRHTFAINFLRNGGDVFVLQEILGHSSLDMVRRYIRLAKLDSDRAHRVASPVSNWRL